MPYALLDELLRYWRAAGVEPRPPCSAEQLREFERRYGVLLPDDVRAYFSARDGMDECDWDAETFHFRSLDEVRPATLELSEGDARLLDGLYLIADWSISAHEYAIRLSGGAHGEIARIVRDVPERVAGSFSEFLRACIAGQVL